MRKNVIALILLLPLIFVLIVFTSVKTVSLGVPISAGGVEILGKPEDGVLRLDLAEYRGDIRLKARVTPDGASDREYRFGVEGDAVSIDGDGTLRAERPGEARITATSRDGGFEDSLRAVVYSSAPYDFSASLTLLGQGEPLPLERTEEGYRGELPTGRYGYSLAIEPEGSLAVPKLSVESGFAELDRASGTLFLPFGGETVLLASLDGRKSGEAVRIEKLIRLNAERVKTDSGMTVNGGNPVLALGEETREASFYVEGERPTPEENGMIEESRVEELAEGKYRVWVTFSADKRDFSMLLRGESGGEERVSFTFSAFDFALRSQLPVQTSDRASVLLNAPISFFAVPSVPSDGVKYEWTAPEGVLLETEGDGSECRLTAKELKTFPLEVRAYRNGAALDLPAKRLEISVLRQVSAAQFTAEGRGLSKDLAAAGFLYEGGELKKNLIDLPLACYDGTGARVEGDMALSVSDESIARISDGKLLPVGTGEVEVRAEWRGNKSFGTEIGAKWKLFVVSDAVLVKNSPELYRAAEAGKKIVLGADIRLGTDESDTPLPAAERGSLLKSMRSTFNVSYYESRGEEAKVKYCLELKSDIYGNGHTLSAELFSAAKDGAGQPLFFRGPLDFVRFGQVASVAAQDNICFLARTDGIKLHNLTLLGCADADLLTERGYDLSALDLTGTVLEVNASIGLENCRIRNGRTVVRVYGGNRSGEAYFSEPEDPDRAERERIKVLIEGCILSQGREFLLKVGANGAVRSDENTAEPDLVGKDGPYPFGTNELYKDEAFYRRYVLTDVTLRDSVLETSGFFTVGVESNFSGELLQAGGKESGLEFEGWRGAGGTSYGSVLRLEGDVRLYDWKELSLIDSSTLIKTELPELKLDIAAMLNFVCASDPDRFGELLDEGYVHGGIAFYGGGKNYGQLDLSGLKEERSALNEYKVNISVLENAEGGAGYLGRILPAAAGTQDFRFYLYGKSGLNRERQRKEAESGEKYGGIKPIPLA